MRIALLTYRGNMFCGGQGIYAAHLANEWKRAGHDVHVIAGPPLPALDDGIPLHVIPNENVFGVPHPDWARRDNPFRLLWPLNLWELGVSRIGVFPEMQTFGLRLLMRWRALQQRHRFDIVFDNQCLSWGLLGIQAAGTPVVSVIHHPLHIDREADYAIDPSLGKKIRRTLYFPLFMQQIVAPRLARIVTVSEASRAEIQRYFGIPEKEVPVVYNGTDPEVFRPMPGRRIEADLLFVGRTEDRKKGIGTLLEAMTHLPEHVTLKIVDGRIPEDGLVPRFIRRHGLERRVLLQREMLTVAGAGRAVLDRARGGRAVLLRRLRLPRQRGHGLRTAGDRQRRGRAAGGGGQRRPGRRAGAAARSAGAGRRHPGAAGRSRSARSAWGGPPGRGCSASSAGRRPRRVWCRSSRRRSVLLTVDLARLEVRPGDLVLDAGCGEGRHCFGALERGARVVGLDLDRPSLDRGSGPLRARARELGAFGVMIHGNTFRLPFRDGTFDRVICSEVMEHVHDWRGAARELARVVRPEGTVAITIPTATSEQLYLRLGDDYFESPGGHIRIFRPRTLAEGLAEAGLSHARRRLRPRPPHALLGAALHRGAAAGRREPPGAGLSHLPHPRDVFPAPGPSREAAQLRVPQERRALRTEA